MMPVAQRQFDVIIIGAGPAGIAAATSLKQAGISNIAVIDRENDAGGVPRHCEHPTFGLLVYKRPMKGSQFVRNILVELGDVIFLLNTTVLSIHEGGEITVSDAQSGVYKMQAKRVIIATGVRETPRHARLVSGLRPQGVLTTGALQQFVYLRHQQPCKNPVIIGTELASFSALWTLRSAGVQAKYMIEENARVTAFLLCEVYSKCLGASIKKNSKLIKIGGLERVEYVEIQNQKGDVEKIACDAVIFTGQFVGEYTLIRNSHLKHNLQNGFPQVDQYGQASDACYYFSGNMLHPADMGDQCYLEGLALGSQVAYSLSKHEISKAPLDSKFSLPIICSGNIKMSMPSCLSFDTFPSVVVPNVRVHKAGKGRITISAGEKILYQKQHSTVPARRILLKSIKMRLIPNSATHIKIQMDEV